MTKWHPEINQDLLSSLRCYLAPKEHWRKIKFDTNSLEISADSGDSSSATSDEIYFIPGTNKNLTGVTNNGISEGLKVAGCGLFSWIFQDDKKENIELIIEQVLHIPGLPIRLIWPQ